MLLFKDKDSEFLQDGKLQGMKEASITCKQNLPHMNYFAVACYANIKSEERGIQEFTFSHKQFVQGFIRGYYMTIEHYT